MFRKFQYVATLPVQLTLPISKINSSLISALWVAACQAWALDSQEAFEQLSFKASGEKLWFVQSIYSTMPLHSWQKMCLKCGISLALLRTSKIPSECSSRVMPTCAAGDSPTSIERHRARRCAVELSIASWLDQNDSIPNSVISILEVLLQSEASLQSDHARWSKAAARGRHCTWLIHIGSLTIRFAPNDKLMFWDTANIWLLFHRKHLEASITAWHFEAFGPTCTYRQGVRLR